ncbi:ribosome recycling factor [bacterium]|nr:ribosome recycling factor [bacterium]
MLDESFFKETEEKMKKSVESMLRDFANVRTGRATPGIIEKIPVEAYGSEMPLNGMANISVPEARTLVIQPFDRSQIGAIERAIYKSELGVSPQNDGQVIRLIFPPLTQERRKDLAKGVHKRAEEAKVALRTVRRDALEKLKGFKDVREDDMKKAQDRLQKLTDKIVGEVASASDSKEKEIMEI